jgi:hypothetical protein
MDHYRELPVSLPARVGELANTLTVEADSPYERALAIEEYLRGMTYSTRTSAPPPDRDWVDYLLFDSRSGYCDYFATAMVVMLRTQGVPARVASGFASGSFDEQEQAWLVRESEAHSWPEAYFPGYGWIAFEPSAIREPPERGPASLASTERDRSDTAGGAADADFADEFPLDGGGGGPRAGGATGAPTAVGLGLLSIAFGLMAIGLLLAGLAWSWDRGLSGEPVARRRYAHLRRWLAWGRWRAEPSATPYELARRLGQELPRLAEPAAVLAHRHVEATYGPGAVGDSDEESEAAWQRLRGGLAVAMLRHRLQRRKGGARRRRGAPRTP